MGARGARARARVPGPGADCAPSDDDAPMGAWLSGRVATNAGPGTRSRTRWAPALVRVRQVHGADILVRRVGDDAADTLPEADIIVSNDPTVAAAIQTADCVPLLLADRRTGAVAAAHAGWRGLAAGVPADRRRRARARVRQPSRRPHRRCRAVDRCLLLRSRCRRSSSALRKQGSRGDARARGFLNGRSRRRAILRWRD